MIHASGEDYLETILLLKKKNGNVRSIDIARELGYSKASISRAMSILKKSDYIIMGADGQIQLTDKGMLKANEVYERHELITTYLVKALGVSYDTASEDACRIEHVISEESFEKIKAYVKAL